MVESDSDVQFEVQFEYLWISFSWHFVSHLQYPSDPPGVAATSWKVGYRPYIFLILFAVGVMGMKLLGDGLIAFAFNTPN